ncbi:hypothetical protein I6F15_28215 [Bradyrhizobium sp. BRP14]|nr:hypothetical protein [Bradyrhizobium sp. BRP14]
MAHLGAQRQLEVLTLNIFGYCPFPCRIKAADLQVQRDRLPLQCRPSAALRVQLEVQRADFVDNLFGAEQISLGGYSNVHGTRASLLFGQQRFLHLQRDRLALLSLAGSLDVTGLVGELRPYGPMSAPSLTDGFFVGYYQIDGADLAVEPYVPVLLAGA